METMAEALIKQGHQKGLSEGLAKGRAEGKAEGRAEATLHLLSRRGIAVDENTRALILACEDLQKLELWFDRAVSASTVEELLQNG